MSRRKKKVLVKRKWTARELTVVKRLVAGGHSYKHMAEMTGRTESSLRDGIAYYRLNKNVWYYKTGMKYSPEVDRQIQDKIYGWIWGERLTATEMARRIKSMFPPGLHVATVCDRIRRLDTRTQNEYEAIKRHKKSVHAELMHKRRRIRIRQRFEDALKQKEDSRL